MRLYDSHSYFDGVCREKESTDDERENQQSENNFIGICSANDDQKTSSYESLLRPENSREDSTKRISEGDAWLKQEAFEQTATLQGTTNDGKIADGQPISTMGTLEESDNMLYENSLNKEPRVGAVLMTNNENAEDIVEVESKEIYMKDDRQISPGTEYLGEHHQPDSVSVNAAVELEGCRSSQSSTMNKANTNVEGKISAFEKQDDGLNALGDAEKLNSSISENEKGRYSPDWGADSIAEHTSGENLIVSSSNGQPQTGEEEIDLEKADADLSISRNPSKFLRSDILIEGDNITSPTSLPATNVKVTTGEALQENSVTERDYSEDSKNEVGADANCGCETKVGITESPTTLSAINEHFTIRKRKTMTINEA